MTAPDDTIGRGKLIVFEGIDGTGKSTQVGALTSFLVSRGIDVVRSYEPTRGVWGRKLRESAVTGRLPIDQEIDLFLKDRKEHVGDLILPGLKTGKWVLLDRYYLSMMAYQGARGQDAAEIRRLNEEFAPEPDLVFWLDVPVDVALRRIGGRGASDCFEARDMLLKCRDIFESVKDDWMVRIDATESPQHVHQLVVDTLFERGLLIRNVPDVPNRC